MPNLAHLSEEQLALHIIQSIRSGNTGDLHALEKAGVQSQTVLQSTVNKYPNVHQTLFNKELDIIVDNGGTAGHAYLGYKNDKGQKEWYGFYPKNAKDKTIQSPVDIGNLRNEVARGERFTTQRDADGDLIPKAPFIKQRVRVSEEGLQKVKQLIAQQIQDPDMWRLGLHDCISFPDTALRYAGKVDGLDHVFKDSDIRAITKPIKHKVLYRAHAREREERLLSLLNLDSHPFQVVAEAQALEKQNRALTHRNAISMLEARAKHVLATKPIAAVSVTPAPQKGPISAPPDTSAVRATKRTQAILHQFPKSLEVASQSIQGPTLPLVPESSRIRAPSLAMQPLAPVVPTAQQLMKDTLDKRLYLATIPQSKSGGPVSSHQTSPAVLPQFQAKTAVPMQQLTKKSKAKSHPSTKRVVIRIHPPHVSQPPSKSGSIRAPHRQPKIPAKTSPSLQHSGKPDIVRHPSKSVATSFSTSISTAKPKKVSPVRNEEQRQKKQMATTSKAKSHPSTKRVVIRIHPPHVSQPPSKPDVPASPVNSVLFQFNKSNTVPRAASQPQVNTTLVRQYAQSAIKASGIPEPRPATSAPSLSIVQVPQIRVTYGAPKVDAQETLKSGINKSIRFNPMLSRRSKL